MGSLRRIGRNISRPIRQVSSQASRFASQAAAQARRTAQQAQAQAQRAAQQAKAQAERTARQAAETAKRTARQTAEQAGRAASQASKQAGRVVSQVGANAKGLGRAGETVIRQQRSTLKGFDRNVTRPYLAPAAAVALPIAAAYFGGPLGLAAGLQVSSRAPGLKNGWQKAGGSVGLDKDAMKDIANYGSIGAGAYGLGSMAFGGSPTSWAFGGSGNGLFGLGGGANAGLTPAGGTYSPMTDPSIGQAWQGAQAVGSGNTYGATAGPLANVTGAAKATAASPGWGWLTQPAAAAGGGSSGGAGLFGGGLGTLGKAVGIGGLGYLAYNLLKPADKVPKMEELPALPPEEPFSMPGGAYIDAGAAMPYAEDVAGIAGDIQGLGQQQINDYNALYRPLLSQYAGLAAQGYDGDYYANRASADVAGQFAQAQGEQQRGLSRFGLNPNSPAYQSQMYDMALAQAAAEAGVRTDAREWAADASRNALAQGASFGQGIFSSGLGALGNAANAYNGLNSDYTNIAGANANTAASAYQSAYQAQQDYQAQLYQMQLQNQQNAYQNRMNQYSANQTNNNAMLGLAGTLTGAWLFG